MGNPERLLRGGDGIGWKDLGRENMQTSVKWSNNPDTVGFLGGSNALLFLGMSGTYLLGGGTVWAPFLPIPSTPFQPL